MPDRQATRPAPGQPAGPEHDLPELADLGGGHHALPGPTLWPMTLAGGATLLAAGVATSYFVSAAGLILMVMAVRGWVRDLQQEDPLEPPGVAPSHSERAR